ncbi:sugar kinase [Primorskyibacter sp. S187A]|uniref:sugar kinase n=1 Tax=Primorskyibacter sp. S187A TaxID=3415130 RepID=UPI003C7DBAE0
MAPSPVKTSGAAHVLAIGECMAELAPAETEHTYGLGFAGDTFNTAWYLAQHAPNTRVSYFTALGCDTISDNMAAFFRKSGIDDAHVQRIETKTVGLYLISLDKGERSFSYWRGQSAARDMVRDPAHLMRAIAQADILYLSGITLAILDSASQDLLLSALQDARSAGKTIMFDPNLRPRLWSSPEEMCEVIMRGAAVSDIALPSFEDEATWFGDADLEATAARYQNVGVSTVIVKNGEGSIHYVSGDETGDIAVEPAPVVVDTTAAGDSFNAGFLAGYLQGKPLADCILQGSALARQVIQAKGALVSVNVPA